MLNSSPDSIKAAKINECILRRRARNLRAKVKALLPTQTCCKYDQQDNRKTWGKFSSQRKWIRSQQKQNLYYYEKHSSFDNQDRFQKLNDAEIEQIKEDKLYYLGNDNIADFQQYLLQKQKSKNDITKSAYELIMNAFVNLWSSKDKDDKNIRQQANQSFTDSEHSLMAMQKKKKIKVDDKLKQFEQRRKIIEYEQKSKRLMNKVKLNMRLERAEVKLEELKWKKMAEIEMKRDSLENKFVRVSSKRKNFEKNGQIKGLEEQLRRTFLTRMSKTATQASQTARVETTNFS